MNAYDIALFIHLLGVVTLFLAIGIAVRGLARLRDSTSLDHALLWLGLVRTAQSMFPAALLLLLASGLYMTADAWSLSTSWIATGLVSLLVMGIVGGGVKGRRLARIGRSMAETPEGTIPVDASREIALPGTWASITGLNGAALGVLFIMATRPGWVASIGITAAASALGAAVGAGMAWSRSDRGTRSGRGGARWIAPVLALEALTFFVASGLHLSVEWFPRAAVPEAVIGSVLLVGAVVAIRRSSIARTAAIASQAFALAGTALGLSLVAAGIGPRTAPDVAYHVAILVVLPLGIGAAVRARPTREDRETPSPEPA